MDRKGKFVIFNRRFLKLARFGGWPFGDLQYTPILPKRISRLNSVTKSANGPCSLESHQHILQPLSSPSFSQFNVILKPRHVASQNPPLSFLRSGFARSALRNCLSPSLSLSWICLLCYRQFGGNRKAPGLVFGGVLRSCVRVCVVLAVKEKQTSLSPCSCGRQKGHWDGIQKRSAL